MSTLAVSVGPQTASVYIDGEYFVVEHTQPNFKPLVEELRKSPRDIDAILGLVRVQDFMARITSGRVEIGTNELRFKGEPVGGYMVEKLLQMLDKEGELGSWAAFMDNVMDNPDPSVRDDLYKWMEVGKMPITPDGHLIAFKKVRGDFRDVHSGTFDNSPGAVLEMDRALCDSNRNRTCSTGFHFCSVGYLSNFAGEKVVVVKVNPRDVTAIPADYNNQKARCCRYVVEHELSSQSAASHKVWGLHNVMNLEDPQELPGLIKPRGKLPSEVVVQPETTDAKMADAVVTANKIAGKSITAQVLAKATKKVKSAPKSKKPAQKAPVETPAAPKKARKSPVTKDATIASADAEPVFSRKGTVYTVQELVRSLTEGSLSQASKALGIPRTTLHGWAATLRKKGLLP